MAALGAVVTKSVSWRRGPAGRPADGRDAERDAQLDRPAGPGDRRASSPTTCPGWPSGARGRSVSIAGGSVDDFAELARRLRHAPALVAVEVNISCPNVEDRGQVFACDPVAAARVVGAVRAGTPARRAGAGQARPRTSPTSSPSPAPACRAGADGLTLINTLLGLVIDPDTLRPVLAGVTGGLSGPAIRPVAVRCVWQVHAALPDVPILGTGGIATGLDALQFVLAGASAVSVGTAVFGDPSAPARVLGELRARARRARLRPARRRRRLRPPGQGRRRAPPGPRPDPPPRPAWRLGSDDL